MNTGERDWPRITTTAVAAVQGLAMLGYGLGIVIIGLTSGLAGPTAVSSPTGAAVEATTFALLGAGLLATAAGRWRSQWWSTTPFVLAQLLALAVGIPLITAEGSAGRSVGALVTGSAVLGLAALLVGALTAADESGSSEPGSRPAPGTES